MESNLWFFYAVVTMLFWGVWGAFIERPEKNGFPATLGYAVWAFTMVPCALVALAVIGWVPEHDLRSVVLGSAAGLLGAAGQLVLFDTLRRGPAYLVFPVISLSPVVSVLLSVLLLGETASPRAWTGIVLALLAMPLLSYQPPNHSSPVKGRLWFVLAFLVFLAWGIQAYVLRFANATMRSESIFFYMMLTGLLLVPVAVWMTDFTKPINWGPSGPWLGRPHPAPQLDRRPDHGLRLPPREGHHREPDDQRPRPRHHDRPLAGPLPGGPPPRGGGGDGARRGRLLPDGLTAGGSGGARRDDRAEARLVAQRLERRLDRGAGGGEPGPPRRGPLEAVEGGPVVAAQRVGARRVVGAHGVVGAGAHPALVGLDREVEGGPARGRLAEAEVRLADPLVQLDEDARAQRVVHAPHELHLARVLLEGLPVPALEGERVAEAHVRPDERHPRAPGQEGLLQLDRAAGRGLRLREVPEQRRAVRELEGAPAGPRVEGEGPLVGQRPRPRSRRAG